MTMTLEQLKRWARTQAIFDDVTEREQKEAIAAIDAFTQPAQAVDVRMVREVIEDMRAWGESSYLRKLANKLTAALAHTGKE